MGSEERGNDIELVRLELDPHLLPFLEGHENIRGSLVHQIRGLHIHDGAKVIMRAARAAGS